jgi:bidirectional [NiFe] hydrogenase diaphorase subunit
MIRDEIAAIVEEHRQKDLGYQHHICVCTAAGCASSGSVEVKKAIEGEIQRRGQQECCRVKGVGCLGLCSAGPLATVKTGDAEPVLYRNVSVADAPKLVDSLGGEPAKALLEPADSPFFRRQQRIVSVNSGVIDPEDIGDYFVSGGYCGLIKVLTEMAPFDVIQEIMKSGLRGRGGGGYPTGLKWSTVAKAPGPQKYVICNADEGDPGAFMDRSILESDPHRVIEGMIIGGYAVGATAGYIYIRAEYPLAIERLRKAIRQAEQRKILGHGVAGSQFDFKIELRLGAGAFVCGEETALISSIEGKRGNPRPRPPYPAQEGLWGASTLINNVETFANVPTIVENGGEWYAGIGSENSKGTKVFALAGKIRNSGLIEVPMGITIREVVYDIGGGVSGGGRCKAVQTGGPSGGCIPESLFDTPIDYESLAKLGSMMGSGGMIVMDEKTCMVDMAKFFMEFCMSESCGKCVPCRVGTAQMHGILQKITSGSAEPEDVAMLEELCDLLKQTSLCGLGLSAPNSVLSTLRYFRDEYTAHVRDKVCPAGVCKIGDKETAR